MSEQNRALAIRWFEEVWNQGSEPTIDELFHPQGHAYGFPSPDSDLIGPEAFKAVHRQFKSAFSGITVVIEDLIVEGDRVALRWTSHMTHSGNTLGFAATNKKVALSGSSFIHIHNGQIMHGWNHMDFTNLAQQLQTT
jgi:predicted ester cyclase